ncbi:MAG TPA: protein translocase subunit SecD [Rhizomicrobium sp.]|nr:protein translocase subunit SecD [Rhizomicrobium sp.]
MLQVSLWSRLLTLLILVGGILIALPNALSPDIRARMPKFLPSSAVNLGLDLQGGSYLLLGVDFDQVTRDRAESLMGDIRAAFRKGHIASDNYKVAGDTVSVRVTDAGQVEAARGLVQGLNPNMTGSVLSVGGKQYDMTETAGVFTLRMTDAYKTLTRQQVMDQSIEVVRRRIDELGTREPTIERNGEDRILVQVPGLQDPSRLKALLGKTAKMTFQLVDEQADPNASVPPIGDEILPVLDERNKNLPPRKVVVERRVRVSGDRLTDASQGFDQQTGQPIVNFRFDNVGARQFGDVTKEHVGHRFAIVLDKQVISDPNINSVILGGSGYIIGSFTTEQANDMAILLRAGALPAQLKPLEERTVGAELGADSIKAGRYSALAGLALVALFMILRYGLFGLFADIALTLNVVLLLATLTAFGATLTLPGIAGIVLTMGMAVDANVLIYERIREEQRNGRTMLASIDTGFRRAMATIIDANATHLIASLILFELGSGPVKGFAVTLAVGIITSFFTAVMVTRLIVITWLNAARPRKLMV